MKIERKVCGGSHRGDVEESHPAFGMVSLSRVSCNPPANLFGSSVRHGHYITLTIKEAKRQTSPYKDWYFGRGELITVAISGTQLGEMLSSMNVGDGVPCTIERFNGEGRPRIEEFTTVQDEAQQQMKEQLNTLFERSKELVAKAQELVKGGAPKKSDREGLLDILTQLSHGISCNLDYAGKCFDEKMERTVMQAKGEVETFINSKIHAAGLRALGADKKIVEIE